jgi:hypothetical protein
MPDAEILKGRDLGDKGVDADAGLPRDDPHLPPASTRRGPPLRQLGQGRVAPHKVRRATKCGRRQAGRGLFRLRPTGSHQGADRRPEPIPPAVHRFDQPRGVRSIAQHPG